MFDKIKDAATPTAMQVTYGPFKGVGPGVAAWHCNHATAHPGMRAVYYEG